jgi:hypothetical protein
MSGRKYLVSGVLNDGECSNIIKFDFYLHFVANLKIFDWCIAKSTEFCLVEMVRPIVDSPLILSSFIYPRKTASTTVLNFLKKQRCTSVCAHSPKMHGIQKSETLSGWKSPESKNSNREPEIWCTKSELSRR